MANGFRYKKTRDELEFELVEQLEALHLSSISYDDGRRWEAKRLAVVAYILLHDGGRNSRSLLGQLGQKPTMLSSTRNDADALLPLADVKISPTKGAWFDPHLEKYPEHHRWLKFGKWYEEVVFQSGELRLSRKNIIHTFRSQMGGGHVDGTINNEAFHWLKNSGPIKIGPIRTTPISDDAPISDDERNFLEQMYVAADGSVPFGPEASMRQIAWEIMMSLKSNGAN